MSYNKRDWTMPVIVIIGIFVLTLLLNTTVAPVSKNVVYAPLKNNTIAPTPYAGQQHVYVLDQTATDKIFILSFSLTSNGFLVISDKKTDEVLGVSGLLKPGLYGAGTLSLTKPVTPGQKLIAEVYSDDGNGVFDGISSEKGKAIDKPESAISSFVILDEKPVEVL